MTEELLVDDEEEHLAGKARCLGLSKGGGDVVVLAIEDITESGDKAEK